MSTVEPSMLTLAERGELERRMRAQTTPHRAEPNDPDSDRQRAQLVLLAATR